MRLTFREQLDATPDEAWAVLTDPEFQRAKCAATTEGGGHAVDVSDLPTGRRVRTERTLPATGLPDVARSFVGETLTIVEVLDWSPAGGGHRAVVDLHVQGAPLTLKGTLSVSPSGAGTVEELDAELKANVPFIGGRIEKSAAEPITAGFEVETRLLREWLARG